MVSKLKNTTMKSIANDLGVSTVTVSKALTNKDGVSRELRQRIKQKAEEMGYVYNPIPKLLLDGKTYNIAIIVSKKFLVRGYDVYFQIYEAIVERLSDYGYYGLLEVLTKQAEFDCEVPRALKESKVDGIILLGQISPSYLKMITSFSTPIVLLDFYGSSENMAAVVADNFYGSYMLTSHLIENGHNQIGFVGNYKATSSIMDRYMGYLKALIENEIFVNCESFVVMDRDAYGNPVDLTLPNQMPTAFVCNNDEVANSLITKLTQSGYRVPEDISVVGFDNFEKSQNQKIGITTVEVDFIAMGKASADVIVNIVKDPQLNPGRQLVGCRLVIRESVRDLRSKQK